jgi:hypothetical protein
MQINVGFQIFITFPSKSNFHQKYFQTKKIKCFKLCSKLTALVYLSLVNNEKTYFTRYYKRNLFYRFLSLFNRSMFNLINNLIKKFKVKKLDCKGHWRKLTRQKTSVFLDSKVPENRYTSNIRGS